MSDLGNRVARDGAKVQVRWGYSSPLTVPPRPWFYYEVSHSKAVILKQGRDRLCGLKILPKV